MHQGVFSTLRDTMSTPGNVQYTGECSEGYHDECGGIS